MNRFTSATDVPQTSCLLGAVGDALGRPAAGVERRLHLTGHPCTDIDTRHPRCDLRSVNQPAAKTTPPAQDYPPATLGSRVAEHGRRKANKMTAPQCEEYFRQGMGYSSGARFHSNQKL